MLSVSTCEQAYEMSHHTIITRAFLYWQLLGKVEVKVILICLTDEVADTWTENQAAFFSAYNTSDTNFDEYQI